MSEEDDFKAFAATLTPSPEAAPGPVDEPKPETPAAPESTEQPESPEEPKPEEKAEKPVEEKKPEPKTDWKAAAEKERTARQARQQARAQAAEKEEAYKAAIEKAARFDKIEKLSKEDKLALLDELGIGIDTLNNEYVAKLDKNPSMPTPAEKAHADELAALKAELKELKGELSTRKEQETQARRTQARLELHRDADTEIKSKPEQYDSLMRHPKGQEIVINLLVAHHRESGGEEMSIEEACREAELYLEDQLKPFAGAKVLSQSSAPKTTTLSGDMRQSEPRQAQGTDENKDFLNTALRLLKQSA